MLPVSVINTLSQNPSNIKKTFRPSEKQHFPNKKNYIPVPDFS